jgi:adenylate cyclase class 2
VNASSSEAAPLEIEAKVRVRDRGAFERSLSALGARPGPTEHETNTLFDDEEGSLVARGEALRVRETEGRGLLTMKGKATVERGVKSRVELETSVGSAGAMTDVLLALGYRPRFFYEKRRTLWRFADPSRPLVAVDETPIGLFAEIEGTDAGVRALASELGVAESELLHDSYVALYGAERRKDPSLPPDMRFREGSGSA